MFDFKNTKSKFILYHRIKYSSYNLGFVFEVVQEDFRVKEEEMEYDEMMF
jgi:hypothetical protein